jgi:hypothetical protein
VIVAGIAVLVFFGVISAETLAVVVVVAATALIEGFVYQWMARDNYSFWGVFGSSALGGILGYVGFTTGAFAAAWGWLRDTALPAAWNWVRNTAWPWIVGRGKAARTWMRTVAWPWLKGKGTAAWNWIITRPIWGQIKGCYIKSIIYFSS